VAAIGKTSVLAPGTRAQAGRRDMRSGGRSSRTSLKKR
jgi:hypothetical protein